MGRACHAQGIHVCSPPPGTVDEPWWPTQYNHQYLHNIQAGSGPCLLGMRRERPGQSVVLCSISSTMKKRRERASRGKPVWTQMKLGHCKGRCENRPGREEHTQWVERLVLTAPHHGWECSRRLSLPLLQAKAWAGRRTGSPKHSGSH